MASEKPITEAQITQIIITLQTIIILYIVDPFLSIEFSKASKRTSNNNRKTTSIVCIVNIFMKQTKGVPFKRVAFISAENSVENTKPATAAARANVCQRQQRPLTRAEFRA